MGVGLEIGTSGVIGNEAPENRSGRLTEKFSADNIVSAIGNSGLTRAERQMAGTLTVSVSRRTDVETSVLSQ
ncbi:MAG: hypothetical protein J6O49_06560 [Bacteroidaceae bacterium]|nr:hypothetical protein [Bacteroidaceae bacterium]